MPNFDVEYHPAQSALEGLIESIDRPGEYCTHGRLFAPLPRLEVAGAGLIPFPVPPAQAEALVAAAERAPYGRGPDTVLDRSVRDCWQIDAANVDVGGGAWSDTLAQIVDRAAAGLGCPRERTETRLYKLLVYEPGGFFSAHRDSEKAAGMVATLVISLPVAGTGGDLVVRHRDRETVIDLRTEDPSELAFAAFYADCVHETRPVVTGHRIVLVYQLLLRGGADGEMGRAPDYDAVAERIAALLKQWDRTTHSAEKLVWLLEHEYSEEGLSFAALKNTDAAVARALTAAAQAADCALYAAILHVEESCAAEYPQDLPYGVDLDDSDLEAGEVIESDCWLDGWVAPDDAQPEYGRLPLRAGELLPAGGLDDADPDDEWVSEATGNAGVEIERAYRSAALVVWPRARTAATLARSGIGALVAYVDGELERSDRSERELSRLRDLAAQLIDAWPAPPPGLRTDIEQSCRAALRLLCRLGDRSVTLRFLREVATSTYRGGLNEELAAAITPAALRDWLPEFISANLLSCTDGVIDLVWRLSRVPNPARDAGRQRALRDAARLLLHTISGALEWRTNARRDRSLRNPPKPLEAGAVRNLLALAWHFDLDHEADATAALLIEHPGRGASGSDRAGGRGGTVAAHAACGVSPGLHDAVAPCRRLPAGTQCTAARGARRLGAGGHDLVPLPALPPPAAVLRRPAGAGAAAADTRGTAPTRPSDHRQQRPRPAPRDRAQGETLHPGLHQDPRRSPEAARAVRRGHYEYGLARSIGRARRRREHHCRRRRRPTPLRHRASA